MAASEKTSYEIRATPSTPEETSWIEYQRQENQAAPRRLEETAKYLSGLSSISLTIMLGPYNEVFKAFKTAVGLKVGVLCWVASIACTLIVVFPFRYRYIANSETSIRQMNKRIAGRKMIWLLMGSLLYLTGIGIVAWIYLFYPAPIK